MINLIIIIFILFGALLGFKRGFTKELVTIVGFILVLVFSFLFKNYVASIFYEYLPFFKFNGLTSMNIILYESISMLLLIILFGIILRIIIKLASGFEKILNFTIILGIPSKILGCILGIIEYIGISFIILYVISVNYNISSNSSVANKILNSTPVLSSICNNTLDLLDDVYELKKSYKKDNNNELNNEIINLMLDKKIISKVELNKLIEKGKLQNINIGG